MRFLRHNKPGNKSERLEFAANISFVFPGRESRQQFSESRGDKDLVENVYYMLMKSRIKLKHIAGKHRRGKCQHTLVTPCCDVTDSLVIVSN